MHASLAAVAALAVLATASGSLCPAGWTLYQDVNGAEGKDACLSPYTNGGASVGVTWDTANSACATMNPTSPYHLLTFAYTGAVNVSSGTDLLSVALRAVGSPTIWVGAVHSASSGPTSGWSWTDGTPATNLNCGVGCDAWVPGAPRYR